MKTAQLLRRAPTLVVFAVVAYAAYSIHGILQGATGDKNDLAKGLGVMMKDVLRAGADEVRDLEKVVIRDPFRVGSKQAEAAQAEKAAPPEGPDENSLAEFVKSLTLDATFVQGRTQIAIINGRTYQQGQHLMVQNDDGQSHSPLLIEQVHSHSVTLAARGRQYELGYPDQLGKRTETTKAQTRKPTDGTLAEIDPGGQLAFYKKLLNSPLGKLGKSLTGRGNEPGRPRRARGAGQAGSP